MVGIFRNASPSHQFSRREWLKTVGAAAVTSVASRAKAQFLTSAELNYETVRDFMKKRFFHPLGSLKTKTTDSKERLISILEIANKAFKEITTIYPNHPISQRKVLRELREAINKQTQGLMSSLKIQTITDLGYLYNSAFVNDLDKTKHSIESLAAELKLEPNEVNLFIKGAEDKPVIPDAVPSVTKLLSPLAKSFQKVEVFVIDDSSFRNFGSVEGLRIVINKPKVQKLAESLEISYEEAERLALANEYMHIALKQALSPRSFDETSEEPLIVKDLIPGVIFYTNRHASEFLSDVASINEQPRDIVRILGWGVLGSQHDYCSTADFARKITSEFCDKHAIERLSYNFDGFFKTLKQHFNNDELLQEYFSYVSRRYTELGVRIVETIRANQEQLPLRVVARVLPAQ